MTYSKDEPSKIGAESREDVEFLNGSPNASTPDTGPSIDQTTREFVSRIEREIEEEVRAKRAQGAFPPAFERRLKTIFERLVPPGAGNSRKDFEALLRSSDRAAYFDIDVPIASQKPGVAKLKKLLRTTQAWYLNYLTQQLNNFSTNLMRLLYVFDARVRKLEDSSTASKRIRPAGEFLKPCYPDSKKLSHYLEPVVKDVEGRLLIADCDNGYLVSHLAKRGLDCYGIDSYGEGLDNPVDSLDLRWEEIREHLSKIADSALGGIVLQGSIDLISPEERIDLAIEVKRVLAPGGTVAIASIDPQTYQLSPDFIIQRDLAPGSPFAPETWRHVLSRMSFTEISSTALEGFHLTIGRLPSQIGPAENDGD